MPSLVVRRKAKPLSFKNERLPKGQTAIRRMVVPVARNTKTFMQNNYFDGMNDRELRKRYNFGRELIEVITGLVEDILKTKPTEVMPYHQGPRS